MITEPLLNLNKLFLEFNRTRLTDVFQTLFRNSDYYVEEQREIPFNEAHTLAVYQEGIFEFKSFEKIPFFVIELKEKHRLQALTGKKYQFTIARMILKATGYDAGLFLFFNSSEKAFRFSYVFSVYSGTKRMFSHYKRFSFYVAEHIPNRTFLQQLSTCSFASSDDLLRAFSLEPVTREFYQLLEKWYYHALNHVVFPPDAEAMPAGKNIQLIRFITRMLFIWFLKVKGVVPGHLFDENQLRIILKDKLDARSSSFYLAILQNLFFATLNTPVEKRKFRKDPTAGKFNEHYMKHHVFRHHALVEHPDIFQELFGNIPFLNGGIFECLDYVKEEPDGSKKEIRLDGFSDVKSKQPVFPNHLLFGNSAECLGLIPLLKTFHFTIDENSAVDQDVALDPELLGHVFENLLATFNPETAQSARKQSGSFYTPREVVDFMCRQTLAHYLHTRVEGLSMEEAEHLTSDADELPSGLTEQTKIQIVQALMQCRVLDPACGSGAFPMGMLHRMVQILRKTDPECNVLNREQEKHLRTLIKDYDKHTEFINKVLHKTDDYKRKLHLIENCIFGTDIQPIAIQISKLRFFISLLVEEEAKTNEPNMGMRPLPNLDVKFLVANTLLDLNGMNTGNFMQTQINNLRELMHAFFEAHGYEEKNNIRRRFDKLKTEMLELIRSFNQHKLAAQLEEFNPFLSDCVHHWFNPYFMFGISDGFDVVIGNPPYIQLQKDGGKLAKLYQKENYKTFARTGDIYALFYEKGLQLLKPDGHLCYITSNKWMRAGYGEKLRQFFTQFNPMLLIDLGPGVFENATVDTNILLIQKKKNQNQLKALILEKTDQQSIEEQVKLNSVVMGKMSKDAWFIGTSAEQRLKEKIERLGKPLKEWDVKIYRGILTGLNEAFIITTEKRNEILANCKDEEERRRTQAIIKPILRGRDIKRYYYEWAGLWVIGTFPALNLNIDDYPAIKKYFLDHFDIRQLEQSGKKYPELGFNARKKTGNEWFETQDQIGYYAEFEKEKVIYSEIVRQPQFFYDCDKFYVEATGFIMTGTKIKYICGLLNSFPVSYFFKNWYAGGGLGEEGYRFKKAFMEKLPLPLITEYNEKKAKQVEELVDKILLLKNQDKTADTTELELEIDRLVYKLYDLTEEEVRMIEKSVKN